MVNQLKRKCGCGSRVGVNHHFCCNTCWNKNKGIKLKNDNPKKQPKW